MKNLDAILVSQFSCFFCRVKGSIKLQQHLKRNLECQRKYLEKFKTKSLDELQPLIRNLKRRMMSSRSKVSKNLEYTKRKEAKNKENENRSLFELLNSFRRETSFANVNLCYQCQKNICSGDIVPVEEIPEDLDPSLRRFQSYVRCKSCSNGETIDPKPKFYVHHLSVEGKNICLPSVMLQDANPFEDSDTQGPLVCVFPATLEALHHISTAGIKSRSGDAGLMYKLDPNIDDIISISYENEMHKYLMAKVTSDRFQGTLKEGADKKLLTNLEKVAYDHVIVGSASSQKLEEDLTLRRMEQHGSICFSLSVSMPVSEDTLATCLIQRGVTVTVDFVESSTSEIQNEYFVHSHSSAIDCHESCVKEKLQSYLPGNLDISTVKTKFLGTHLISVHKKMQSFVKHFLKDASSPIFSEDYSIKIKFEQDGEIKLTGNFWPKEFDELNKQFANQLTSMIDSEIVSKAIKFINANLSTSTDSSLLKSQFELSDYESKKLAELATRIQYHFCGNNSCKICSKPRLPSLYTDFTISPDAGFYENIQLSAKFRKIMVEKLRSTDESDLLRKSSEDWLNETLNSIHFDVSEERRSWTVEGHNFSLTFTIDRRLLALTGKYANNPMLALYHYCLTCCGPDEEFQVIIETKNLRDCYTKPYLVTLLKAFQAKMEVMPVNGYCQQKENEISSCPLNSIDGVDDGVKLSHRIISVEEAFSLLDKNLERTSNSTSSEFISAFQERKLFFKKVPHESDVTLQAESQTGFYEKQNSNIDKYLSRRNGGHVTLAEFCLNYDFVGSEQSRQILKLFSKNGEVTINDSELKSAYDPEKCLPDLIVTSTGHVMKIRTKRKLIYFPEFDDAQKENYRRVLMFFPISKDPTNEDVQTLICKCDDDQDQGAASGSNTPTIIDRIERFLFPKKKLNLM